MDVEFVKELATGFWLGAVCFYGVICVVSNESFEEKRWFAGIIVVGFLPCLTLSLGTTLALWWLS